MTEKSIEHGRIMKINPFGNQTTLKKGPKNFINKLGRSNYANNKGSQRSRGWFRGRPYPRGQQITRGQQQQQHSTNFNTQKQCYKCGNQFGENHLQSCPAKDKICSKCAKRALQEMSIIWGTAMMRNNRRNWDGESSQKTDNDPVAFAEFTLKNGWDEYQIDKVSVMVVLEAFEIKKYGQCIRRWS